MSSLRDAFSRMTQKQRVNWCPARYFQKWKSRLSNSKLKAMIEAWLNEFFKVGPLIKNRERCLNLWKKDSWVLHQKNGLIHNSLPVKQLLASKRLHVVYHRLYSPDFVYGSLIRIYSFTRVFANRLIKTRLVSFFTSAVELKLWT